MVQPVDVYLQSGVGLAPIFFGAACWGGLPWLFAANSGFTLKQHFDIGVLVFVIVLALQWKKLLQVVERGSVHLRADEAGVLIECNGMCYRGRWEDIGACTLDEKDNYGVPGNWITLRNQSGEVLTQLNRAPIIQSPANFEQSERFIEYVEFKLREQTRRAGSDTGAVGTSDGESCCPLSQ